MCTINRSRGMPFGSDGCPVPVGNSICGETKTLDIINEFKRLYEEKMQEIDNTSCGDCLQEKIKLQQDWIGDLTEQNEMLVRAVEELEQEATERVKMLEEKLQRSAECICAAEKKSQEQNSTIHCLEEKIVDMKTLSKELNAKKEECECLQKNMVDMRQALTEEVATKHDTILKLKRECQELEDRCIQADKQTAFKDDIIKELRKEIKQLKQQISLPEKPYSKNSNDTTKKCNKPEQAVVINHTKKVVQPGKSTVVYLHHDIEDKDKKSVNEHLANCTKCRLKFENRSDKNDKTTREACTSFICKSENDLLNCQIKSIKERSKLTFTNVTFSRRNTFIGVPNTEDVHRQQNVSVPNHIPVRTYVNNLEINKTK